MVLKIGFSAETSSEKTAEPIYAAEKAETVPRKSMVRVYFPSRDISLTYYNDRFDLSRNNLVYVEGKLQGERGRVMDVNYNFKIKPSEYKRVTAVIDNSVSGQFFMAESHFVTFDPAALPVSKARMWFMPPAEEEDEIISGSDDTAFWLDDLNGMNVKADVAQRGHDYYMENKVRYVCIDGTHGYAIVEGGKPYEVEFEYEDGKISNLTCTCFCSGGCKHEFATMLQLHETLSIIEKNYESQYEIADYFSAVNKSVLFALAVNCKETGSFTI